MLSLIMARFAGNKHARLEDFLPRRKMPESDEPATIDEIVNFVMGFSNGE